MFLAFLLLIQIKMIIFLSFSVYTNGSFIFLSRYFLSQQENNNEISLFAFLMIWSYIFFKNWEKKRINISKMKHNKIFRAEKKRAWLIPNIYLESRLFLSLRYSCSTKSFINFRRQICPRTCSKLHG